MLTLDNIAGRFAYDEDHEAFRQTVRSFLQTALSPEAQQALPEAGYVPLPDQFRERIATAVAAIQ